MRKLLSAAIAAFAATAACAQPAPQPPFSPTAPKLLIVISVDQFSADLWDIYRPEFTGGFARLASGTVFHNGYQSHAATETCPGHSTILTGDRPATTGIVSNLWFDPKAAREDKTIYCAEDESAAGSSSTKYQVSPTHLRVPTLGEILKQRSPASMNVAVAGKDRSAVMMSGHVADQRWYPSGASFVTDLSSARVPAAVTNINAALQRALAAPRPPLETTPFCAAKGQAYQIAGGGKPVGAGRFGRAPGDAAAFRASPESDGAVLALAAGLVQEMRLGADRAPDILSISLAGTDYVGHTYGPGGQEMCLQLLSLDRDLGDFFARLDAWGIDYSVVLTADHGALDIPERLRAKGIADAAWIDPALSPRAIGETVARQLGIPGSVLEELGPAGDIYLDPQLRGSDRARALSAVLSAYRAHRQVYAAYSKDEIARTAMPSGDPASWSAIERVRASFDPQRSGDLYVVLKPHIQPIADTRSYVATHGSPWDYDRRVPILFWRRGMAQDTREDHVETVDIMPTLAALLGLGVTRVDGRCLNVSGMSCAQR